MLGSMLIALAVAITLVPFANGSAAPSTRPASSRPVRVSGTRPATTTTSKPATRRPNNSATASRKAVDAAVATLSREFREHLVDPSAHPLRASSNYFDKSAAEKLDSDVTMASLTHGSADVREACYINRQLLSALPPSLDDATARSLLSTYRSAPAPNPRPGISQQDQQKLDGVFKGKVMSDEVDVKQQWQAVLDGAAADNAPILAHRDELYRRLPKTFETFAAAMEDLLVRMNAVADAKDQVKTLAADVKEWASTQSPPPEQLASLAKAARRLADSKGPQYYVSASWRESSSAFAWRKTRTGVETGHELKSLADFLEEQSRQPVLKLEMKDRSDSKPKKETHAR